ncbi:hypothetical protein Q7P37_009333 [Cladosporium fusiforme]
MSSSASTPNTAGCINRIVKEIAHIQKGTDLSLAVACRDDDVRRVRALIIGPPDTPYEFGFFDFQVKFPKEYPITSPAVTCITTDGGRTRFNPNIYAQGKVCLSILGTWHGEKGEEWSSAQGLESVMLSIQSLMSPNPYENEPGHEDNKITEPEPAEYARKVRHETLRIAVVKRLEKLLKLGRIGSNDRASHHATSGSSTSSEGLSDSHNGSREDSDVPDEEADGESPPTDLSIHEYDAEATYQTLSTSQWEPFGDLMKRRFLWYYDSYISSIDKQSSQQRDGKAFALTPFEFASNAMAGNYNYTDLRARIERIRHALSNECTSWVKAGAKQVEAQSGLATQLAFQFNQLKHKYNETTYTGSRLELSLPNKTNPFAWHMTLFGQNSTNLDGGVFNISMTIPPNFPSAWPRVYVETPIFHHRVSATTGVLCYFPHKPEEIGSHIKAVVAAIEDLEPKFDPRAIVNPEAAKLLWGSDTDKKMYFRKLRRSAQESSEF